MASSQPGFAQGGIEERAYHEGLIGRLESFLALRFLPEIRLSLLYLALGSLGSGSTRGHRQARRSHTVFAPLGIVSV
jgi:hypothetical protein